MKKTFILIALGSAALLTACNETLDPIERTDSNHVPLKVSIASDTPATKTNYSGAGEVDTPGGPVVRERINWTLGDILRIASDKAYMDGNTDQHWVDYKVSQYKDSIVVHSRAVIVPNNAEGKGLTWQKNGGEHKFYGMYPSPALFSGRSDVKLDALTESDPRMWAFIPATQYVRARGTSGAAARQYIPSTSNQDTTMRYAWMYSPIKTGSKGSGIELSFRPVFTAFEFVLDSEQQITVKSVTLQSESRALNGPFSVKTAMTFDGNWHPGTGDRDYYPGEGDTGGTMRYTFYKNANIPELTNPTAEQRSSTVTLPGNGVTLVPGEPLSVTILALPQAHKGLTVIFDTSVGTKKLELKLANKTTWIAWRGCRKYRIRGLTIPAAGLEAIPGDEIMWKNDILNVDVIEYENWGGSLNALTGDRINGFRRDSYPWAI